MRYEIDEEILEKIYNAAVEKPESDSRAKGFRDFINLIKDTKGTLENWEDELCL